MAAMVGGIVAAVALGWMILAPGLAVLRLGESASLHRARTWLAAVPLGYAVSSPVLYIAGRLFGYSGVESILATGVAAGGLLLLARLLRGRSPIGPSPSLPRWVVAAAVLLALTILTAYAEFSRGADFVANTVTDWNERQAAAWAISHDGLPLVDPLFYPGHRVPMYYPAGPYLAVAAAGDLGGVLPDWPYALLSAGLFLSMVLLAADAAARIFRSRRAGAWAAILVAVGGLDLVVNAALTLTDHPVSLGHVGAWASTQGIRIDGLYEGALWAAPHLAPTVATIVVLGWLPLDVRRRPGSVLALGLVLAGMFYLSPYGLLAAGAVLAAAWLIQTAAGRWRRWLRHGAALALAAALSGLIALVWIADSSAADPSGGAANKLVFGLPAADIHPVSALAGVRIEAADLAVQIALELLPVIALGLLGWYLARSRVLSVRGSILGWTIPVILVLILVVRSPGWNIWGLRATHLMQLVAAILGGGWMAWAAAAHRRWRYLAWVGILVGFGATAWEVGTENVGRLIVIKPPARSALHQACAFIDRHTSPEAVVLIDPRIEGRSYARRWSNRRALLANDNHGSRLFCNQADLNRITALVDEASAHGLNADLLGRLRAEGATVAIMAGGSRTDVPPDRILLRNDAVLVVDLGPERPKEGE